MMYCIDGIGVGFFFFQAEDGIRDADVTGVQTCALPILSRSGVINTFTLEYANKNRKAIKNKHKDITSFKNNFEVDQEFLDEFFDYAVAQDSSLTFVQEDFDISGDLLKIRLKAMVAQNLWDYEAFYQIFNVKNEIFMEAYKTLKSGTYEKMNLIEN